MTDQFLASGSVIGEKYRLKRPIGSGGFSHVYMATHTAMDRTVAIKIFDPTDQANSDPVKASRRAAQFEQEAQLVSQLTHPNTVTIYDFGVEDDGKAYLAMEFIEGQTLKQVLKEKGRLDRTESVTIFLQILASLEEAHHRNILHRDLKPANIMLTSNFKNEQVVKVLDFGIARMLRKTDKNNSLDGGLFLGTPRYASPEQLTGKELSLATDIYGVGALLWQCVVGQPMVPTSDIRKCVGYAMSDRPWEVPTDVDTDIAAVIERAVHKIPAQRYPNASAMMEALEECGSVDRHDLPEIREDDFFTRRSDIVDPNIIDPDDSQNFFVENPPGSAPPLPPGAVSSSRPKQPRPPSRPGRHRNSTSPSTGAKIPTSRAAKKSDNTSPSSEGIELTTDPDPEQRHTKSPKPRPNTPLNQQQTTTLPLVPILFSFGAILVVGALSVGLFLSNGDDNGHIENGPFDGGDQVVDQDFAEQEVSPAEDSRFSVEGAIVALRSERWRVRTSEPIDMTKFRYHPVSVSRDDLSLDIIFYETKTRSAIDELHEQIEAPEQQVTLDHIVVKIRPRGDGTHHAAESLQALLQRYYEMVTGEAVADAAEDNDDVDNERPR